MTRFNRSLFVVIAVWCAALLMGRPLPAAAASFQVASILVDTEANVALKTGLYTGQTAVVTDRNGAEMTWNGSAWKWAKRCQPLTSLRSATSAGNDTTEDTLLTYTLPKMGANDWLRVLHFWTQNANASAKTVKVNLGATGAGTGFSTDIQNASAATANYVTEARNMNNAAVQKWMSNNKAGYGASAGSIQGTTRDTGTAGVVLTITGTKATAGDTLTLEWADVFLCGGG